MKLNIKRALNNPEERRLMEKEVLSNMIEIYCHGNHHTPKGVLCPKCKEFETYALMKTDKCPFMATKTFCSACKVHCYSKEWKPYVKKVMRYAGPRMIFYHPFLALLHGFITLKQKFKKKK